VRTDYYLFVFCLFESPPSEPPDDFESDTLSHIFLVNSPKLTPRPDDPFDDDADEDDDELE
jgi:hypothetical protein